MSPRPKTIRIYLEIRIKCNVGVWLRDQKVAGSNPVTSTRKSRKSKGFRFFFYSICTKRRLWRFFHATDVQPWEKGQRHYTTHKKTGRVNEIFPSFRPDFLSNLCIGYFCILRLINRYFRTYHMIMDRRIDGFNPILYF